MVVTAGKLAGEEIEKISFHDLIHDAFATNERLHKPVVIRGFLYLDSHKQWVLSNEPNLRSCCVGLASKSAQQILLQPFDPIQLKTKRAVAMQGTLELYQGSNYKFLLKNAQLIDSERVTHSNLSLLWLILTVSLLTYLLRWGLYRYMIKESYL